AAGRPAPDADAAGQGPGRGRARAAGAAAGRRPRGAGGAGRAPRRARAGRGRPARAPPSLSRPARGVPHGSRPKPRPEGRGGMSESKGWPRSILLASDLDARSDRALDRALQLARAWDARLVVANVVDANAVEAHAMLVRDPPDWYRGSRSEEHTSELQSREKLVCRLLLEKQN